MGIEGPRDDLTKWIVHMEDNRTKDRRVLSIFGFGGLGKTTLATEVYRKIREQFHCHAFISVSQKPDIKKIVKDVISQVSCHDGFTKDIHSWDERRSIEKLREQLQDKR
jgi:disease resistance protein RPM1